jgi:hypothetical protein
MTARSVVNIERGWQARAGDIRKPPVKRMRYQPTSAQRGLSRITFNIELGGRA